MNDAARVDVLETAKNLVQEELYMLIAQHLVGLDNLSKISLHEV